MGEPVSVTERRRRYRLRFDPPVVYAIGDVHGHLDKLLALEALIVADAAALRGTKAIVMLGDYVDGGPNSAATLAHLVAPPPPGFHRLSLAGNHDDLFLAVLEERLQPEAALPFGALATFASYGCHVADYEAGLRLDGRRLRDELQHRVPPAHRGFLRGLPVSIETPRCVFVHAGIRPGRTLDQQTDGDLQWIREPFLSSRAPFPKLVVHGHSPSAAPVASARRIGVDTGAAYGGPLTAARITSRGVRFLSASGGRGVRDR